MNKIKTDDSVIVIAGKDKGRVGKVLRIVGEKLLVEGANLVKKHTKPNPNANQPGGIIEKEMPLHRSNVAVYNPSSKKADRVGIRELEDGRKVRYFKSDGELVDI